MMLEEVPCDKESNHQSINGFGGQADNARRCTTYTQLLMCSSAEMNPSETPLLPSEAALQLEQHEPFVAVDDSATLMVVPCIERPLLDADSCAASAFLLTV